MDDEHTINEDDPGASQPAPRRIGRYAVIERIGEGAMGVVYAAFDPELSRKLAIKVLHRTDEPEAARQRLVREAQALARLSHPNVVQIYDVGTLDASADGEGNRVWVAMELAEGGTLRQWLATPRSWRDVLSALQQAGRGLAAAHKSGIVHRDFKPDNVLVGTSADGSFIVRVVDFGLARAAMDSSGDDAIRSAPSLPTGVLREDESASDSLGERFTRTGARLGTPAYMAPEQWIAAAVDARTDQFAFCVVAWESLYGRRPFQAETMAMLGVAITQGRITPPPSDAKVPAWIHRLLLKGLAVDPADRHADMDALLGELARDPSARRRRVALGVVAAATIGASAWIGASLGGEHTSDPCAAQQDALAEVWNDTERATVDAALRATGRSYADDTAKHVDARLSSWAEGFVAARHEACAATLVRGEQSAEAMDLRIACLDRGRLALGALVDVLASADAAVLDRAVQLAEGLPDPAACADVERLRDAAIHPEDPRQRDEVDALRQRLARGHALDQAARYDDADAEIAAIAARVAALDWAPLTAELDDLRGLVALGRGDAATAEAQLRSALLTAIAGRHDRQAWSSATTLAQALAQLPARSDEARRTIALARAQWAHARLGPSEEAVLENAAFRVEAGAGDYAAARTHIERCIALREADGAGEDAELAGAYANLGSIYGVSGDATKAAEQLRRAIAIRERVQSPKHPAVGRDLHNLGSMLAQDHRYDEAAPLLERALAIKREALGDDHPDVAYTLISLGNIAVAQGRFADAEHALREALAIQERALGSDHPDLAFTLLGLGDRFLQDGRPREALPLFARALAIRETAQGADHPEVAPVLLALGVAELAAGDAKQAIAHLERARPALVELGDANELKRVDDALAKARGG